MVVNFPLEPTFLCPKGSDVSAGIFIDSKDFKFSSLVYERYSGHSKLHLGWGQRGSEDKGAGCASRMT